MEPQLLTAVERLTGRQVLMPLSGNSTLAESSVEVFVPEPLLPEYPPAPDNAATHPALR